MAGEAHSNHGNTIAAWTGVGVIITVTAVTTAGEAVAGNHPQTKKRRIERRFFCACDLPGVQYCVRSANGCRPSQTL